MPDIWSEGTDNCAEGKPGPESARRNRKVRIRPQLEYEIWKAVSGLEEGGLVRDVLCYDCRGMLDFRFHTPLAEWTVDKIRLILQEVQWRYGFPILDDCWRA
jgi:hypothetical protein